jgi:excisionase family DNA binding protein
MRNKAKAETATAESVTEFPTPQAGDPAIEFITTDELARRLRISTGTVANWRKAGKLAFVVTPGRSIRFHWPTVTAGLLRMQRNSP